MNRYRIEEREQSPAKASRKLIGTIWNVRQIIERVGYEFQPTDFDEPHVSEVARQMMQKSVQHELRAFIPVESQDLITASKYIVEHLIDEFHFLPIYQARYKMMQDAYREQGKKERIRTFWYRNQFGFPYYDYEPVEIVGVKQCVTGIWYPASGGHMGYYSWDDYEPAGLDNRMNQTVYIGQPFYWDQAGRRNPMAAEVIVHPLDLIETAEQIKP